MSNYRKLLVAFVTFVLIGLDQVFGISVAYGADDIVTVLLSLAGTFGVWRLPND